MREMKDDSDRIVKEHSTHDSWWDGPRRYSYVNRNVIGSCQTNTIKRFLAMFYKDKTGFDIGGPGDYGMLGLDIMPNTHINADGQYLPFRDNSIDYLFSSHALEHIPNPKLALSEAIRVLKPGSVAFIIMPDKRHFRHENAPTTCKPQQAPSEMEPSELKLILSDFDEKIEILCFDTRQNNFDFEVIFRKKEIFQRVPQLNKYELHQIESKIPEKVLKILACSICKRRLDIGENWLSCHSCKKKFPVLKKSGGDVPVMLKEKAQNIV